MPGEQDAWERRRIEGALERIFPQARSIDLAELSVDDGRFLALLRLPTRMDEATVAIHRYSPQSKSPPPEEHGSLGLPHRLASGHGQWRWLVEYDDQASEAEVIQLVVQQLLRDPQLGDSEEDDKQRYDSMPSDSTHEVWWVCAAGPHIFPNRADIVAEDLSCPVPGCGSAPLDQPYASEHQAQEAGAQRQGGT
jgi:hypothetical protein